MQVAKSAITTPRQHHPLADIGQVGDHRLLILVQYLGSHGHAQYDIAAIRAGALFSHARHAVLGKEMLLIAKIDQRVQPLDRLGDHIAAPPAIAAIRPAIFDIFLAPERYRTRAPGTGTDINLGQIKEFHREKLSKRALDRR